MIELPRFPCPACQAVVWGRLPIEGIFACENCRFAVDLQEPMSAAIRRAVRWRTFPSADAGLPPRFHAKAGADPSRAGLGDFLPAMNAALRMQQDAAVAAMEKFTTHELTLAQRALIDGGRLDPSDEEIQICAQLARLMAGGIPLEGRETSEREKWVMRQYGGGEVSYCSVAGPMIDPRDANYRTQDAARAFVQKAAWLARAIGMKTEAVPLNQAIQEYETQTGRHAPGAARVSIWPILLVTSIIILLTYRACSG